ncbi:tubulin-tyrosine ligase family protein, putative (macronuclear) [Tetrahymena thermophila SB210]|uniref:Tubulin-tyrosine ligase family protein, putative n=1 Tax=Tetrahymena thermophila (strain SB210) TaxID=312017 RepID=W7WZX9_TETTS|nr:tubulin-tyrosine ligase family protein, putative [Tetrahymena thermophila SB210]EWS72410.1 tubulin-tyrosine ligase family protein, putative [Tetrahymena thermophila SB210]|eukprot:XP_012655037.1 tubulin-tyrosine ligase family protein, putative [Tetrahymena thermophila SB210]
MWILLCDSILHDRFEIQGTQVYKILKGVSFIKSQVKEEYKIELIKKTLIKLRDIMSIVILDQQYQYKLEQLDEIANIYLKENMLNEQFIKLIDFGFYQIINIIKDKTTTLSDQDLSHIININFIFSINSYYSQTVNNFLQNLDFQRLFDQNLIKMMAIAIFLKSQNQLSLNLDNLIESKLQNYDFNSLSLSDLNILLQSLSQLDVQNTEQIIEIIDQLILESSYEKIQLFTLNDLKNTQIIRQYKDDKLNRFAIIASQSFIQVDDVIDFLEYINQQNIEHLFKELYNVLPQFLAQNCNLYNWEQQCLLYYFMRKDQHLMDDFHYQNGFLNVLKEYIKLYYAQRSSTQKYVQPLPLSSNFYKILSVIDLAELFSDSHYS